MRDGGKHSDHSLFNCIAYGKKQASKQTTTKTVNAQADLLRVSNSTLFCPLVSDHNTDCELGAFDLDQGFPAQSASVLERGYKGNLVQLQMQLCKRVATPMLGVVLSWDQGEHQEVDRP